MIIKEPTRGIKFRFQSQVLIPLVLILFVLATLHHHFLETHTNLHLTTFSTKYSQNKHIINQIIFQKVIKINNYRIS